jgi:tRNA(Ile)-lysidine synthase
MSVAAPVPSTVVWPPSGQHVTIELISPAGRPFDFPATTVPGKPIAWLDADRFTLDLRLRSRRPGDVFCPAGMGGHRKKLQDFLTDLKVARSSRETIPLLVAPEGILCVIGYRADHRFLAGPTTERVLRVDVA